MQVNKVQNNPNFQAKLIYGDRRIEKFIKSSFMADSKATFSTLDKYSEIYPDAIVSINVKSIKNKDYMVAKNGITGAIEKFLLGNAEKIDTKNRTAFIDLVKNIMNKKTFWTKCEEGTTYFDATSIEPKVQHKAFDIKE